MFLTLISLNLMTLFSPINAVQSKATAQSDPCTITCTVTVVDPTNGGSVSFTATAGGWFVSCETAGERACERAYEAAANWIEQNP